MQIQAIKKCLQFSRLLIKNNNFWPTFSPSAAHGAKKREIRVFSK